MRRRMILEESGEEDMANFELLDTIVLTPSDKYINIDLLKYGKEEFYLHGDIPLTANESTFRVGINGAYVTQVRKSNIYTDEMFAHIFLINEVASGIAGFNNGWSDGSKIGPLIASPRSEKKTLLNLNFYPYVEGDEEAVIEIYGR